MNLATSRYHPGNALRKFILQIIFTFGLLVSLFFQVDWKAVQDSLQSVNPLFFIASTAIAISGTFCLAVKYHVLIKGSPLELSLARLVTINFITRYYALLLPTAIGPEAVRWYKVTKGKGGRSFFLASTIVERIFFLLVLLLCGAIPLLFTPHPAIQQFNKSLLPLLAVFLIGLLVMLTFFLVPFINEPIRTFLLHVLRVKSDTKLHGFVTNFSLKNSSPGVLAVLFVQTVIWQFLFLMRMYLLFKALDLPFNFWDSTWMGSLVLLLQTLPVTYAGLGLREGAYAYLFQLQGVSPELGVTIGLLFFTQLLIFAAIGCFFETMEACKSRQKQNRS
ncbi:MAG TPA: flippase-like domain-containing protein [Desulfobacteraceae bacterium]|nr:flippase-like domain-containing protein [Desulfobacteraceae bacterium]